MYEFDIILKHASITFVEETEVIVCHKCNSTGYRGIVDETDAYYGDDKPRGYKPCESCAGDGRLVKNQRYLSMSSQSYTEYTPFPNFSGDPHFVSHKTISVVEDKRDPQLEEKYPKLANCTYTVYNKLVEDYRLLELIDKDKKCE